LYSKGDDSFGKENRVIDKVAKREMAFFDTCLSPPGYETIITRNELAQAKRKPYLVDEC
jgi:hypothetical protein